MLLPVDFSYWGFALLIGANGIGSGMFGAPNSSSIMSSVPASQRGVASGMGSTFQNSGTALSIGVFVSLMIAGLASNLPKTLTSGLQHQACLTPSRITSAASRRCRRCSQDCSA
jgi:sugar phosphate permease